jgi:hypothetical protein
LSVGFFFIISGAGMISPFSASMFQSKTSLVGPCGLEIFLHKKENLLNAYPKDMTYSLGIR